MTHIEQTEVSAELLPMVQADTSAFGRVAETRTVNDLPLVNRNFTQKSPVFLLEFSPDAIFSLQWQSTGDFSWQRFELLGKHSRFLKSR
jgi:hypothetical protein